MLRLSRRKLLTLILTVLVVSWYVLPLAGLRGIHPDPWVLLILFYAFRVDWKRAPWFGLGVGLFKDLLSIRHFGIELFSLGTASLALSYVLGKVEREEPLILVAGVACYSLLYETLVTGSYLFLTGFHSFSLDLLSRPLWMSLYTLTVFPFAFILFEHLAEGRRQYSYGAR